MLFTSTSSAKILHRVWTSELDGPQAETQVRCCCVLSTLRAQFLHNRQTLHTHTNKVQFIFLGFHLLTYQKPDSVHSVHISVKLQYILKRDTVNANVKNNRHSDLVASWLLSIWPKVWYISTGQQLALAKFTVYQFVTLRYGVETWSVRNSEFVQPLPPHYLAHKRLYCPENKY